MQMFIDIQQVGFCDLSLFGVVSNPNRSNWAKNQCSAEICFAVHNW